VFNLGTGTGSSVQEVITTARQISEVDIPVEYTGRRPGDPVAIYADNAKARAQLGWNPEYGLEEIVRTAWDWHSAHPNGWGE
jgi:UDP-glucose 4-epimerase